MPFETSPDSGKRKRGIDLDGSPKRRRRSHDCVDSREDDLTATEEYDVDFDEYDGRCESVVPGWVFYSIPCVFWEMT